MNEWNHTEKDSGSSEQLDLEERLAAYYGPQLQEQPLSSASWQRLRSRLGPQRSPKRWRMWRPPSPWFSRDRSIPMYIQETLLRIVREARMPYLPSSLQCSFRAGVRVPTVRVSAYGRHKIHLVLPSATEGSIGQPELNVLIATGLARYLYMRKPMHIIVHAFVAVTFLLAVIASILLWTRGPLLVMLPIAVGLCVPWSLHVQGRKLAFRADALVVQWLGRGPTCQGLHALADRSHSPRRSKWGEPSLSERIDRVCGTRVAIEEDRLMLVR